MTFFEHLGHVHYLADRIRSLEVELLKLGEIKAAAEEELEKACLKEFGSHHDDGGFMHGKCVRCGAFLG